MISTVVIELGKNNRAPYNLGGKATNLDLLLRAKLPVPPALAVFPQQGHWQNGLAEQIEASLGRGPYFVRSSFVIEDRLGQSFAGQGLTLGHLDRSQVAQAIEAVWASWHSPHAKAYRSRMGLNEQRDGCVIVQKEAVPIWSGVLFTQSPDAIGAWSRIEAVKGYGEALAQGKIVPLSCEFHRRTRRPLDHLANADLALVIKAIAPWLDRLEKIVDGPADVEWCLDAQHRIWILQVRPAVVQRQQLWSAALGEEFWSGHVSKLMFSTVGAAIEQTMLREPLAMLGRPLPKHLLRVYAGRIYVDAGALAGALTVVPYWAVSERLLALFPPHVRERYMRERHAHAPLLPRELFQVGRRFLTEGFPWLPLQQPLRLARQMAKAEVWRRRQPQLAPPALIAEIQALLTDLTQTLRSVVWGVMYAYLFAPLLERLLGPFALQPQTASFYQALPNDPIYELDREWYSFAKTYPEAIALPTWQAVVAAGCHSKALLAYQHLLDKWGHRAEERDIAAPRWAERPESVWYVARLAAQHKQAKRLPRWWCWILTTVAPFYLPWRWPRAFLLLLVGWLMRLYVGYRERMRDLADRYLAALRQRLILLANQKEPWNLAWHNGQLLEQCPAYADDPAQPTPPRFLMGDQPLDVSSNSNGLMGIGVSAGQGQGPALWIRSIADLSKFKPGSVMLAEYLDPSFSLVLEASAGAAFVAGGMLSHGAIVAREYGVPAVVGVANLSTIQDGTWLRIDGDRGCVEVIHA